MLVATPFERGPAALNTRANLNGDECDEYVECFRHLEAQSTGWRVYSNCQREIVLQCFLFSSTQSSISLRKPLRRRPTSSHLKNIITVGVQRSIAPTFVPAKFHWQAICRTYAISILIFMYVTCTPAKQSGGSTLFFRTVEHMTKELTNPFHYRDDHMTNDRFQRSAVRMTEEPAY